MKKAQILHNPGAGKAQHSKQELIALVESQGFECGYSSTKEKGWKKLEPDTDFLVVAGGDGTVRQVAVKLLSKKPEKNLPVALLPLGTANNIAEALGIKGKNARDFLQSLDHRKTQQYDAGVIEGLDTESPIFLESFGYGVFPELMKRMKENEGQHPGNPGKEIRSALEMLRSIVISHPAEPFRITADGRIYDGHYLLVEVMNISSIGPNLKLAPQADPGDGKLDLILLSDEHRGEFAKYISGKIQGVDYHFAPPAISAKKITIRSDSSSLHVDDERMTTGNPADIKLRLEPAVMEFLV